MGMGPVDAISMLKKDPKSLNKGTGEIESGQKLIDDTSDQALVDWKMWFRDKIKASYDNGNKEFHNVNDVCTQAEASTYLYKENSPMLLLINTVKQR